jgi:hypothetical protein
MSDITKAADLLDKVGNEKLDAITAEDFEDTLRSALKLYSSALGLYEIEEGGNGKLLIKLALISSFVQTAFCTREYLSKALDLVEYRDTVSWFDLVKNLEKLEQEDE